ncbi:putative curlin production assembly/transport component csgg [Sulfitobacter noctilucicola]|nr:putative curlin production assembly/transport component csgg [Sulfitobacter noctilucicola]
MLGAFIALGAGCSEFPELTAEELQPTVTATRSLLHDMPAPSRRLDVAVYEFEDLTGQFKPSEGFQTLSKAVSQGGGSVLIKALRDTGEGKWFRVVERSNLNNLLQERRVIQEMRQLYLGEQKVNPEALPPMLFAGVIIEGGVIGYDSNTETGGAGAALLGIGARAQYRQDTMSVNLRAVSVKTGEVLSSVVVQKSIISTSISANVFRYVDSDKLLEVEAGVSTNEPSFVALTRTIEKAVFSLIMEMAQRDLWQFKDRKKGKALLRHYLENDGRRNEANNTHNLGEEKFLPSGMLDASPPTVQLASDFRNRVRPTIG